jgi:hypothetical protein
MPDTLTIVYEDLSYRAVGNVAKKETHEPELNNYLSYIPKKSACPCRLKAGLLVDVRAEIHFILPEWLDMHFAKFHAF